MTTQNTTDLIICQDLAYKGPGRMCVVLDLALETVTFENCFLSNSFLSVSRIAVFECSFSEITKVIDFLVGNNTGILLRAMFFLGGVDTSHLRSIFVYTPDGNARVFADWKDFEPLRSALIEKCKPSRGGGFGLDNPTMWPLIAFVLLLLLVGLIWILV